MPAPRRVEPELLDHLPEEDPRAVRSRRDLRRVNAWMGGAGLMARLLNHHDGPAPRTILELGAGDGTFMLGVARRLAPAWTGVTLRLVDRQDLVTDATRDRFAALGWNAEPVVADVFAVLDDTREGRVDAVVANLFLHHFEAPALRRLLAGIGRITPFLAACEPRRSGLALAGSRMLFAIGCNDVTRHDAVASVRAGFTGEELSHLWRGEAPWRLEERPMGLFTHAFLARRAES